MVTSRLPGLVSESLGASQTICRATRWLIAEITSFRLAFASTQSKSPEPRKKTSHNRPEDGTIPLLSDSLSLHPGELCPTGMLLSRSHPNTPPDEERTPERSEGGEVMQLKSSHGFEIR